MTRPQRRLLIPAALVAAAVACGGPEAPAPARQAPPPPTAQRPASEDDMSAARAEQREQEAPSAPPQQNAEGKPVRIDTRAERDERPTEDAECPGKAVPYIRAQTGSSCATYQAEVAAYVERCVPSCDAASLLRRALDTAMGACSAWCSSKSCGTASFIPPPSGCAASGCFTPAMKCPDADCPFHEFCGLVQANSGWNCFCRDMVQP